MTREQSKASDEFMFWSKLFRIPLVLTVVTSVALVLAVASAARAQESWCKSNPVNCVCSEPLTAQSYTSQGGGGYLSADDNNTKKCSWSTSNPGWSIWVATRPAPVRRTDESVLNLMPNRDQSVVTSFLGIQEGTVNSWLVGNESTDLNNVARVVFRFYLYRSANYQFANEGYCTNGKTAEVIAANWQGSELVFSSDSSHNFVYGFVNSGWAWDGGATFDGWSHGPEGADLDPGPHWTRGKWTRHEIVLTRPKAGEGGTDLAWWMTDVTNGGLPKQIIKVRNGCTNCISINGSRSDFSWDLSVSPLQDIVDYAANMYRAGSCAGWNGLSHFVLATFVTDDGQMIGPAVEVEGACSNRLPPRQTGLKVVKCVQK